MSSKTEKLDIEIDISKREIVYLESGHPKLSKRVLQLPYAARGEADKSIFESFPFKVLNGKNGERTGYIFIKEENNND